MAGTVAGLSQPRGSQCFRPSLATMVPQVVHQRYLATTAIHLEGPELLVLHGAVGVFSARLPLRLGIGELGGMW